MTDISLPYDHPYDFRASIRAHGWISLEPTAPTDHGLRRVERLNSGRIVVLHLSAIEGNVVASLSGDIAAPLLGSERGEIVAKLRWMLRLDEDHAEFYELCKSSSPHYSRAIPRSRLLRSTTVFEDAIKVLATTNTTWRQTKLVVARLVEVVGPPVPGISYLHAFPTPGEMIGAGERVLSKEVRLGYRAPYALALAERANELEDLRASDIPASELRRRILSFRGIGPYAAATLLMLLGHYEFLAIDSETRTFTARKYLGTSQASEAEIQALYASWGRWRYLGYWLDSHLGEPPFSRALVIPGSEEPR